jgi:exonuclease SbcC
MASKSAVRTRAELSNAEAQAAAAAGRLEGRSEEQLTAAEARAATTREAAEQAAANLPEIEGQLLRLADDEKRLDAQIAESRAEATRLQERVDNHARAERETMSLITAAIGDAESATALLSRTRARTRSLEALAKAWKQHAAALAAVPAKQRDLTVSEARERADSAESAYTTQADVLADLEARATTASTMLKEATPLAHSFTSALTARRATDALTSAAIGLAALVTAGNSKRLQLRSYALQRRFESVLAAGSAHLERMSSGKFAFELNEDAAKAGQAGLGIWLYDSWTGKTQDPKSLSGGETFYASLALALGLADVIRSEASGSSLETLFVDEGFGSLDQDTLYQVLEQLDQLRAGHRAVGVVSHVTEMKESIPDRIEVRRQPDSTSTIARAVE